MRFGFVNELTAMVVRRVLRDFGRLLQANPDFRINVNVTAQDIADPAFPAILADILYEAGVHAKCIGIEITESCSAHQKTAIESIRLLRQRGHHVYIDDFGTGYSSLSYLHDLSVDAIKIDKSFTQAIGTQAVTEGILPQILSMAKALNLQVVAEGIETDEQAHFFADAVQPVLAQGWFYGHPFPPAEFQRIFASSQETEKNAVPITG